MPKLVEWWSDEASFVHWNQDSSELPLGHCRTMDGWTGKICIVEIFLKIFGINLVFKNGRERAEQGVQEVTGKAPRRFENFACDYATILRPQEFKSTIRIWKKSSIELSKLWIVRTFHTGISRESNWLIHHNAMMEDRCPMPLLILSTFLVRLTGTWTPSQPYCRGNLKGADE